MELSDLSDFSPDDIAAIEDGETDPYGTDFLGIAWREKSGYLGLKEAGRLIARAGWVAVQIRSAAGEPAQAVGLGGVLVNRYYRGRGLGGQLVLGAMTRMRELNRPLGLLFCAPERESFYERLGWHVVPHAVTADQPSGPVVMPLRTYWTRSSMGPPRPPPISPLRAFRSDQRRRPTVLMICWDPCKASPSDRGDACGAPKQ